MLYSLKNKENDQVHHSYSKPLSPTQKGHYKSSVLSNANNRDEIPHYKRDPSMNKERDSLDRVTSDLSQNNKLRSFRDPVSDYTRP